MCDMPIPFGNEFGASGGGGGMPGPYEKSSSMDNDVSKSPKLEPIRSSSTHVPRYTKPNNPSVYQPPRKSSQIPEMDHNFSPSYYPDSNVQAGPSVLPEQGYEYFPVSGPISQSMHQMYGQEPSANYYQQQLPSYQYQPIQMRPMTQQSFPPLGMSDPRTANYSFDMKRNSHTTCEKCGSFCSPNTFNQSFMPPMESMEPQGFMPEFTQPSGRPDRFYYPPQNMPPNRNQRDHILF